MVATHHLSISRFSGERHIRPDCLVCLVYDVAPAIWEASSALNHLPLSFTVGILADDSWYNCWSSSRFLPNVFISQGKTNPSVISLWKVFVCIRDNRGFW